jgi:hypothetical protein
MADVGQEGELAQFTVAGFQDTNSLAEDFEAAKAKAIKIGAVACYVEDLKREFVEELCFPAIQCNAIYENVYLLGEYQPSHPGNSANIPQEHPLPAQLLHELKLRLPKRKVALPSPTVVLAKVMTKYDSSLDFTPFNPPSRSLPHGE